MVRSFVRYVHLDNPFDAGRLVTRPMTDIPFWTTASVMSSGRTCIALAVSLARTTLGTTTRLPDGDRDDRVLTPTRSGRMFARIV